MLKINNHNISQNEKVYIIAEISANHNHDFEIAVKIIEAAAKAGADAVKLQTYKPDTITINCKNDNFKIKGNIWGGQYLYDLYQKAYTPWEWQPKLKIIAEDFGLDILSTPFDEKAVDFLEEMNISAYKVASFELIDIPLLKKIAKIGKPIIMSTGMASLQEIDEAVTTIKMCGNNNIALLKCVSSYPAPIEEMNLLTIPHLAQTFNVPTGLSDHSLGIIAPIAATVLGACIIEKHITLSRSIDSPDKVFSLEPSEFKDMVDAVHQVKRALGTISYESSKEEQANKAYRRSIYVIKDVKKGDRFTHEVIKSIRPGNGLHPRYYDEIINRRARKDINRGTPLSWEYID